MANSWLGRLFVGKHPARRRPIALETLEDRFAPSTFTVLNAADGGTGSLRQAIADAAASAGADTITFDPSLAGKTIALTSNNASSVIGPTALVIANDSVTIDGSAAPGLQISGNGQHRLFAVASNGALTLENITLTNGLALGENGQDGPVAGGGGGAGLGGAVLNEGTLTVLDSTLLGNRAIGGNGGNANAAGGTGDGGGIGGVGGGAGSDGSNGVTVVVPGTGGDGLFGSGGGGGPIGGVGGFGGGGGGDTFNGAPGNNGFFGGSGSFGGGGAGAGLGGAIFNDLGARLTITNSTITANTAASGTPGSGGALAGGAGGALFNRDGTVAISNSTIAGNTAAAGGDEIVNFSDTDGLVAQITLTSSIVASLASQNVVNAQAAGTASVIAVTPNIVQSGISGNGTIIATGVLAVDPQLQALANNGGPTQTMAPASASLALAAGVNPLNLTTDQRGYSSRSVNGATDIGAYQTGATAPTPPAPPSSSGSTSSGSTSSSSSSDTTSSSSSSSSDSSSSTSSSSSDSTTASSPSSSATSQTALRPAVPAAVLNQTFVNNLYLALLHRPADADGLAYYTNRLNNGDERAQIVTEIMGGDEYHTDVVQQLYQTYLHRNADSSGLSTYVGFLDNGGTVEGLREILLSSDEYFVGRGGNTDTGFLSAVYEDVLGRPIDASGLATYPRMLTSNGARGEVARSILTGAESSQDRVQQLYQWLLQRPADSDGLNTYSDILMHGGSEANVIASLAASDEFFAAPARPEPTPVSRTPSVDAEQEAIEKIIGRAIVNRKRPSDPWTCSVENLAGARASRPLELAGKRARRPRSGQVFNGTPLFHFMGH